MSYGSRARIGYTCPVYLAEIFPYDFYKMVPEGVTLVTATASVWKGTVEEMKRSAETSLAAAREMARIGCSIVIFGGVPVGFQSGYASMDELVQELEKECGVPFSTSLLCQNAGLKAVGAKKVVTLRTGTGRSDQHMQEVRNLGVELLEVRGVGEGMYQDTTGVARTLEMARSLLRDNPTADTLHCPSPHWPMAANIDTLEREFPHVSVVTAGQAITWHALRRSGIKDPISGYGRLLKEF
jgi:maleate isomerase